MLPKCWRPFTFRFFPGKDGTWTFPECLFLHHRISDEKCDFLPSQISWSAYELSPNFPLPMTFFSLSNLTLQHRPILFFYNRISSRPLSRLSFLTGTEGSLRVSLFLEPCESQRVHIKLFLFKDLFSSFYGSQILPPSSNLFPPSRNF